MGRAKDDFIARTGGLRLGETQETFKARVAEIGRLEGDLKAGRIKLDDLERVQRRLCDLKGIDFDAPDDEED